MPLLINTIISWEIWKRITVKSQKRFKMKFLKRLKKMVRKQKKEGSITKQFSDKKYSEPSPTNTGFT
jgi:hypothetical protein